MQRQTRQAGFSLIETLVAISILVVAIVGPMTIAARGLQSAYHSRDQLTATLLAQEGIEIVRAKRDGYALAAAASGLSDDWYNEIPELGNCQTAGGCAFDIRDASASTACTGPSYTECRLYYDSTIGAQRGIYTHNTIGFSMSPFTRRIVLTGDSTSANVTVEVSWSSNLFSGQKKVVLTSPLTNHYDAY